MARGGDVVFGIHVPDYVTNKDVYAACDAAAAKLQEAHVDVTDMVVNGLEADPFSSTAPEPEEGN